eukprot:10101827-Alexandrium_andersonii.AAC.1
MGAPGDLLASELRPSSAKRCAPNAAHATNAAAPESPDDAAMSAGGPRTKAAANVGGARGVPKQMEIRTARRER